MPHDLTERTYRGAFWSAVDAGGARFVQFVIGVILARLLLPEQFGLVGMLGIFMAVAQSFLTGGFGLALIQKKEVTRADASSVFYFNLVIGAVLAGVLCLAAPWIGAFYDQPILVPLTRALSLVLVINSFIVVQTAMLTRSIDFKTQAKVNLIATAGSGVVGIAMALSGYGVWSLVGQQISNAVLLASLLWLLTGWRPERSFSLAALRQMFRFGSRVLFSGLLNQVFENVYEMVIGKLFNPAALGFYVRAKKIQDLPAQTMTQVVARVSFPVFAAVHEDAVRLKNGMRRAMTGLVLLNCPIMIGLAVTAEPVVRILLTEKWLPSVPYIQLLCVLGLLLPLQAMNLNSLMAKGRSDLFLYIEILKKVLTVINIAVTWRWGVGAMILGQIVLSVPGYYLNSYYIAKLVRYTVPEQLRDVAPYFLCAGAMGAAIHLLRWVPFHSDLLLLVAQTVGGLVFYTTLCGSLRLSAFLEAWCIVGRKLPVLRRSMA